MKHMIGVYIKGRLSAKYVLEDFPGFLKGEEISIGRLESSDICIKLNTVSRKHAAIRKVGNNVEIIDKGSLNRLNIGGKIYDRIVLKNEMKVVIGSSLNDPDAAVIMYVTLKEQQDEMEPQAQKRSLKPAGRSRKNRSVSTRRLLAFTTDMFVLGFMSLGGMSLVVLMMGINKKAILLVFAVVAVIFWIYFALSESGINGGTFGKKMMDIKVVDLSGKGLSFAKATVRTVLKLLSLFTLFLPVFGKGRCLHDLLAKTKVVIKK